MRDVLICWNTFLPYFFNSLSGGDADVVGPKTEHRVGDDLVLAFAVKM